MTNNISRCPHVATIGLIQSEDYDLLAYEAQRIVDRVLTQSLAYIRDKIPNENERGRFVELESNQWERQSIKLDKESNE